MPFGVPKVPYQGPEDENASWFDLYNGLYKTRAIFIGRKLDDELTNQTLGLLVHLHLNNPDKEDIQVFINCPGGWMLSGIAISDLMETVQPDVQTICVGTAASMATFILLSGEPTKCTAFPHARVMIHTPIGDIYPKTISGDYVLELDEVARLYTRVLEKYTIRTGKTLPVIMEDMENVVYMTAEEAQDHGIIDDILLNEDIYWEEDVY
uniref:ATP-dependent Clp protease proteolytic subunit n=1 Tax=Acacia tysonii TaxID=1280829 RepID=A0A1D0CPX4_9FABA|nr:clpP1 [Acacia tysonii]